jgi:hypothetical protein
MLFRGSKDAIKSDLVFNVFLSFAPIFVFFAPFLVYESSSLFVLNLQRLRAVSTRVFWSRFRASICRWRRYCAKLMQNGTARSIWRTIARMKTRPKNASGDGPLRQHITSAEKFTNFIVSRSDHV